ncbi:sigma-70 family RNA polymerase sigma factor [Amycolatopsis japonica]|uniref:sigma-70 family RNA polymerase sigma factor n=1 Tax=Amycolatopsis japonica TaxID=208439 RepID=UPI0037A8E3F9
MDFPSHETKHQERVFHLGSNPDFVKGTDVFALARSSFAWLVTGPDPVSVDGHEIPGLPQRPVPLDELGTLLLAEDCEQATRDAAWAYLITRARAERGTWMVACVGLGLPVLLRVATIVTRHFTGDTHDLNAAVLTGFLTGLHEVDLLRPAILARLYYAAYREGRVALDEATGGPILAGDLINELAESPNPAEQPDLDLNLVLTAAVRAGAVTTDEAGVISETRLGTTSLAEAAQARGMTYKQLAKIRERAEPRLVAYLTEQSADTSETSPADGVAPSASRRTRRVRTSARAIGADRTKLPTVTSGEAPREKKVRRTVSQNGPKSRIASRGTPVPADRRSRAARTSSGPAAHTSREVRSCD